MGLRYYSSTYWEKNKNFAEAGAALVALRSLGLFSSVDAVFWTENGLSPSVT